MTVDLSYDELVLLCQLVNGHFVKLQREEDVATPFEAALFKKLYDAHMDEMSVIKKQSQQTRTEQLMQVEETQAPRFGGEAGESVPAVDPDDIKAIWQLGEELRAKLPSTKAVGVELMKEVCKPGANVEATCYRSSMIGTLSYVAQQAAQQQLAPWLKEGQVPDPVFRTIASVPMEWVGSEVRHGLPFDVDEFLRRLNEQ